MCLALAAKCGRPAVTAGADGQHERQLAYAIALKLTPARPRKWRGFSGSFMRDGFIEVDEAGDDGVGGELGELSWRRPWIVRRPSARRCVGLGAIQRERWSTRCSTAASLAGRSGEDATVDFGKTVFWRWRCGENFSSECARCCEERSRRWQRERLGGVFVRGVRTSQTRRWANRRGTSARCCDARRRACDDVGRAFARLV